jgi:hypothetical protein
LRLGALPAVIVPSARKAGFSIASAVSVVSGRLRSSVSNMVGHFRPVSSTAIISCSNLPAACAAAKRCWERNAHRSMRRAFLRIFGQSPQVIRRSARAEAAA